MARLARDLLTNLLSATGADELGRRVSLREGLSLSKLVGVVVYIFVLVPALIAALDALRIEAVSVPATEMLGTFMAALPMVFAASVILVAAYLVSRFVAGLASSLLGGVGFDDLPARLGIEKAFPGEMTFAGLARYAILRLVFAMGLRAMGIADDIVNRVRTDPRCDRGGGGAVVRPRRQGGRREADGALVEPDAARGVA